MRIVEEITGAVETMKAQGRTESEVLAEVKRIMRRNNRRVAAETWFQSLLDGAETPRVALLRDAVAL